MVLPAVLSRCRTRFAVAILLLGACDMSDSRVGVRGDTLWGVTRGELGVQRVVRIVLTAWR